MGVSPAKINVESQLKISYNILASPYLVRTILMCFQSPCKRNPSDRDVYGRVSWL